MRRIQAANGEKICLLGSVDEDGRPGPTGGLPTTVSRQVITSELAVLAIGLTGGDGSIFLSGADGLSRDVDAVPDPELFEDIPVHHRSGGC